MLEDNTQAIVAMAWARTFGVPDEAFAASEPGRILVPGDAAAFTALHLLGKLLLHGPRWALDEAQGYSDESLLEVHGLLALAKGHAPRATRVSSLLYAESYVGDGSLEDARVTDDERAVRDLLARCAPDDIDPEELFGREHIFVVLDDADDPQAAAAYSPQQGIIADLVTVSAIDGRGTGALEVAAAVAMHDALDSGLVPQMRLGVDDNHDLATMLGFERLGTLATVVVDG